MTITSNKPYLIRAYYDWIVDNELTPYILVNVEYTGVQVPQEFVVEGRIVLDISPSATRGLLLENDRIVFTARFSGKTEQIFVAPGAVLEIYAKENYPDTVCVFKIEEEPLPAPVIEGNDFGVAGRKNKPSLKLVDK